MTTRPLTNGRFQTTVADLDNNGFSYSPTQLSSPFTYNPGGPRRVNGEDEGGAGDDNGETPDPYPGTATPLPPTPWLLFLLLGLSYTAFIACKKRRES